MASARVDLRVLVDEVRRGCVRVTGEQPIEHMLDEASPRSRLLRQLAVVEVGLRGSQHRTSAEIQAAPPTERFELLAGKQALTPLLTPLLSPLLSPLLIPTV